MEGEKEKEEENTLVGPTWWNERHQKYSDNFGGHAKFQRSVWPCREEVSALHPSRHPSLPPSSHLEGPLPPQKELLLGPLRALCWLGLFVSRWATWRKFECCGDTPSTIVPVNSSSVICIHAISVCAFQRERADSCYAACRGGSSWLEPPQCLHMQANMCTSVCNATTHHRATTSVAKWRHWEITTTCFVVSLF